MQSTPKIPSDRLVLGIALSLSRHLCEGIAKRYSCSAEDEITSGHSDGWDMYRCLSSCIAVGLYFTCLTVAVAEGGKWELEQRRNFIFALSYKQSQFVNNKNATSELAFLCNQENRANIVGAILIPFDGTFESQQDPIHVWIQKKFDQYDRSDLLQKWRNEREYLFLDATDDVADLITFLKDRDAQSDKSVHFYLPNVLDVGQRRFTDIVVDTVGFRDKFADFEKDCASPQ